MTRARRSPATASLTQACPRPGLTERVSVILRRHGTNSGSSTHSISADGRYVAFRSTAFNLVPGDTNMTGDVFVHDRRPAIGVVHLTPTVTAGELDVWGWATFSGVTVASAEDDPIDSQLSPFSGEDVGGEVVSGSVVYRPEAEDVVLRLGLASFPQLDGPPGAPGVLYRWAFTVGGTDFEVRAMRTSATASEPTVDPFFALYECAALDAQGQVVDCAETATLSGGIGTTSLEVRVSVPLTAIGAVQGGVGAVLADVEASTSLGEAAAGSLLHLDSLSLPAATLSPPRVDLGVAPASTPADQVDYPTAASLLEGALLGQVPTDGLPAGAYRVWARACLGDTCDIRSVEVAL